MNINDFNAGSWQQGHQYKYFLPERINHTFLWTDETINILLEEASHKLGELNSFSRFVPDMDMFIRMHTFKEAVFSSYIEGTKTNIEEALVDEDAISPERKDDWKEVNNYVQAMNEAIESLKTVPLSNRIIRQAHKILLASVRGQHKDPGEFRTSQNWIGGTTPRDAVFVPPDHSYVPELVSDLELFLHNEEIKVPRLIRSAIAHYQFETIHPFLDGNGRVGRLLITLYLVSAGILDEPLLYLSDYFEKDRTLYYDNIAAVQKKNDIGQWLRYFLSGVAATADNGVRTLKNIIDLKNEIEHTRIPRLGKRARSAQKLLRALFSKPVIQANDAAAMTSLTLKAAYDLIEACMGIGILREMTGYQRNRMFSFDEYIKLFQSGK